MTAQPATKPFLPALQRSASEVFTPIQREFNRLFDHLGSGWDTLTDLAVSPRMDMQDTKDAIQVTVELPGLTQDDVKIAVEDDVLTVSGEKKAEKDVKAENYRFSERAYGAFSRSILLPRSVDADKIKATMTDGVLKIVAPKDGAAAAKTIEIQSE